MVSSIIRTRGHRSSCQRHSWPLCEVLQWPLGLPGPPAPSQWGPGQGRCCAEWTLGAEGWGLHPGVRRFSAPAALRGLLLHILRTPTAPSVRGGVRGGGAGRGGWVGAPLGAAVTLGSEAAGPMDYKQA